MLVTLSLSKSLSHKVLAINSCETVDCVVFLQLCAEASFKLHFEPTKEVGLHIGAPKGFLSSDVLATYLKSLTPELVSSLTSSYRNPQILSEFKVASSRFVSHLTGLKEPNVHALPGLKQLSALVKSWLNSQKIPLDQIDVVTLTPGYRASFYHFTEAVTIKAVNGLWVAPEKIIEDLKGHVIQSALDGRKVVIWWQASNPLGLILSTKLQDELRSFLIKQEHVVVLAEDHAYAGMSRDVQSESLFSPLVDAVTPKLVLIGSSMSKIANCGGDNGGLVWGNFLDGFMQDFINVECSGISKSMLHKHAYVLNHMLSDGMRSIESKVNDLLSLTDALADKFNAASITATKPEIGPFIVLDFSNFKGQIEGPVFEWLRSHKLLTLPLESADITKLPNCEAVLDTSAIVRTAWCGFEDSESAHRVADQIISLVEGFN